MFNALGAAIYPGQNTQYIAQPFKSKCSPLKTLNSNLEKLTEALQPFQILQPENLQLESVLTSREGRCGNKRARNQ